MVTVMGLQVQQQERNAWMAVLLLPLLEAMSQMSELRMCCDFVVVVGSVVVVTQRCRVSLSLPCSSFPPLPSASASAVAA